ncbi:MAG: YmdB family metallophosphoesterase [Phycisphaerales bacterium]
MSSRQIRIAFLGDIFGAPGRRVVEQQLPVLRAEHAPDLIVANAENCSRGSGLSPDLYRKLRGFGIDAITLGDHVYRDQRIVQVMEREGEPIARPANLPSQATGRRFTRIPIPGADRDLLIITVLGRVFFPIPADDPFAAVDGILASLRGPAPIVLVEAHMEATSEKAAMGHHLDGRVAAVFGTHTHVPTADARILPGGTAFMSDVGMCGPYDSCIGRDKRAVVRHMTTGMYVPFDIADGDAAMCGALVDVDVDRGRAMAVQPLRYEGDYSREPFSGALSRQ